MPHYVIERVQGALNDDGRSLNGSRVLVLGIAYKKNIDDIRESPAAEIIELLRDRGARVEYHDPHMPRFLHAEAPHRPGEPPAQRGGSSRRRTRSWWSRTTMPSTTAWWPAPPGWWWTPGTPWPASRPGT